MRCGIGNLSFGDPVCCKCQKTHDLNVRLMEPGQKELLTLTCKLCGEDKPCMPVVAWTDPTKVGQNRGLLKRGQPLCTNCASLLEVEVEIKNVFPERSIVVMNCVVCEGARVFVCCSKPRSPA